MPARYSRGNAARADAPEENETFRRQAPPSIFAREADAVQRCVKREDMPRDITLCQHRRRAVRQAERGTYSSPVGPCRTRRRRDIDFIRLQSPPAFECPACAPPRPGPSALRAMPSCRMKRGSEVTFALRRNRSREPTRFQRSFAALRRPCRVMTRSPGAAERKSRIIRRSRPFFHAAPDALSGVPPVTARRRRPVKPRGAAEVRHYLKRHAWHSLRPGAGPPRPTRSVMPRQCMRGSRRWRAAPQVLRAASSAPQRRAVRQQI
jgi:hypothetical protein